MYICPSSLSQTVLDASFFSPVRCFGNSVMQSDFVRDVLATGPSLGSQLCPEGRSTIDWAVWGTPNHSPTQPKFPHSTWRLTSYFDHESSDVLLRSSTAILKAVWGSWQGFRKCIDVCAPWIGSQNGASWSWPVGGGFAVGLAPHMGVAGHGPPIDVSRASTTFLVHGGGALMPATSETRDVASFRWLWELAPSQSRWMPNTVRTVFRVSPRGEGHGATLTFFADNAARLTTLNLLFHSPWEVRRNFTPQGSQPALSVGVSATIAHGLGGMLFCGSAVRIAGMTFATEIDALRRGWVLVSSTAGFVDVAARFRFNLVTLSDSSVDFGCVWKCGRGFSCPTNFHLAHSHGAGTTFGLAVPDCRVAVARVACALSLPQSYGRTWFNNLQPDSPIRLLVGVRRSSSSASPNWFASWSW